MAAWWRSRSGGSSPTWAPRSHGTRYDYHAETIEHAVYEDDQHNLGRLVPLTDYPDTEPLAGEVDENGLIRLPAGCPPLVAYVSTVKPNRLWRDMSAAANLGGSDYAGVEGEMDALDEVCSSWLRDIRLAKSCRVPTLRLHAVTCNYLSQPLMFMPPAGNR